MEKPFEYQKYYREEAIKAAENLKADLEKRLIDKTAHAWSCGCGACGAGPSKVVGINIPTTYQDQLGLFTLWTCEMLDDKGKKWSCGLTSYISWAELYPLFRNAFNGIAIPVDHPTSSLNRYSAEFVGLGKEVLVREGEPLNIRLIGDTTNSPWVTAQIRIDSRLADFRGHTLACDINPHLKDYGNRKGRKNLIRYDLNKDAGAVFVAWIFGEGTEHIYFPLARLVSSTKSYAVFELDRTVEQYTP